MRQRIIVDEELISIGREKGYLTYSDISDALPDEAVSAEEIDDILGTLEELDIQVLNACEEEDIELESRADILNTDEYGDAEICPGAGKAPRVDDPVKLYLQEMGRVPLLTKKEEIRLSKLIEEGQKIILEAIVEVPLSISEIKKLCRRAITRKVANRMDGINDNV